MAVEKPSSYPDVERSLIDDKTGLPPVQVIEHATDADEAMKVFEGHDGGSLVLDEATNKRLLRKIDLNILPVCVAYWKQRRTANAGTAFMYCLRSQLP